MCCIVCVFKGVTSTCTEEAKYGTCLTPLGQFQKRVGFGGVGYSGTSREHAGLLQEAGAGNQQRVWMLATEMGETGGKFESTCGGCISPGFLGLMARESKLSWVLSSQGTIYRVLLGSSQAFLQCQT